MYICILIYIYIYIGFLYYYFEILQSMFLKIPKRRAPKNDADWCNRFVQNSHGEPIGDTND